MATQTTSKKTTQPLVERAGRAVFWNAAFFPLKALIGFASSIVLVRLLRTDGFYYYNVTMALLATLGLFSDLGIERTLPRFYPEVEMSLGRRGVVRLLGWVSGVKAAVLVLLVGALLIAPGFVVSVTGSDLGPNQGWLLLMIGVLLVLGAASDVSIQLLYTHFKQKVTNGLDILAAVVYPALAALFVLLKWGVMGAVLALLITTVISVVISLRLAGGLLRSMPDEPHPDPSQVKKPSTRSLRGRLVSYAGLNYLINWSVYLYDLPFVVLALGLLVAAPEEKKVQVAVVSLAYKFTRQFLRVLVVPLTGVQTPLFARLYAQGRIDGLKTAYATVTKFLILVLMPAGVGLIVTGRNLLQIFYGQINRDAVLTGLTMHDAVACMAILTIGLFGEAIISVALNVLMVYEEHRPVIVARLCALISIPLLILLVPAFGVVGAAMAVASAGLGSRAVALAYASRIVGLRFPGPFFVKVGVATILMALVLLPFLAYFPPTILITTLMITLGGLVFLAAFKLLGGIEAADRERFTSLRLPFVNYALRFL
ncbi:MAG: oligosaccharide flippase family protein [Chloroflexia bacterium]